MDGNRKDRINQDRQTFGLSFEAPSSKSSDISVQPGVTAETREVKGDHGGRGKQDRERERVGNDREQVI